ncbi:RAD55 family ATPase [Alicyclobacillus macrosporangiidus]|uniref:RAD55 family ATPase n=1 Tax=Alicyclobacillus macrosporangiidus TaxID=392015 RepID=UPI00068C6A3F|nr:ATPase domain-containing protein [Alicyclobacillus macrosporangiidus]
MRVKDLVETGIPGLDRILHGGIPAGSAVVVEGWPGTGKTVLGIQYLYAGALRGEAGVYITFDVLPEQLYTEAANFGWDLRALEDSGVLRVVCTTPEAFMAVARTDEGWFEALVSTPACRRMVIDSVSALLERVAARPGERDVLRGLRGILRRYRLTTLLIRDGVADNPGPEHYLADGVLRLGTRPQGENACERTLSLVKMRGMPAEVRTYVMRFTDGGITVVPPADVDSPPALPGDVHPLGRDGDSTGSTRPAHGVLAGGPDLDHLLAWTLPHGSVLLLDVDGRVHYRPLLPWTIRHRAAAGDDCFLITLTDWAEVPDMLAEYADLAACWPQGRLYVTGPPGGRGRLPGSAVIHHALCAAGDSCERLLIRRMFRLLVRETRRGRRWFMWLDTNAAVGWWSVGHFADHLPAVLRVLRSLGVTTVLVADSRTLGDGVAERITGLANSVIQMWSTVDYQYLQVVKSANGRTSAPYIVQMDEDLAVCLV